MEGHQIKNWLDEAPLNGSKSYLVGAAALLLGAIGLGRRWFGHDDMDTDHAVALVLFGCTTISFAHKVDKTL